MSAKTYNKKTAAFIGFLIQNIPADFTEEDMQEWMNNPDAMKRFLSGLRPQESTVEAGPLFTVIATTNVDAVAGKKTAECFTGSRWAYRDSDFDNWLAKSQSGAPKCAVTALGFSKGWSFIEAVRALPNAPQTDDVVELGNWLIERGCTLEPQQVEDRVEATERSENTGLRTDGFGNFFFVETGDVKNPVSVGHVYRDGRDWNANVYRLDDDDRGYSDDRLLVCNLDTLKL